MLFNVFMNKIFNMKFAVFLCCKTGWAGDIKAGTESIKYAGLYRLL